MIEHGTYSTKSDVVSWGGGVIEHGTYSTKSDVVSWGGGGDRTWDLQH